MHFLKREWTKAKTETRFQGHLRTYRFCDEVWTFVAQDVKLKLETGDTYTVPEMKIVACKAAD